MPNIKKLGVPIDPASVPVRNVPANPSAQSTPARIHPDRWCRNGRSPSAHLANMVREATNYALCYQTKEIAAFTGRPRASQLMTSTPGTRHRWRFAFHTSPYSHAQMVMAVMHPPDVSGAGSNTYAQLKIFSDTGESSEVLSANLYYGDSPTGTVGHPNALIGAEGWQYMRTLMIHIEGLDEDTTYYGRFQDVDYGIIQSAAILDLQSMTEFTDGYLAQNISAMTPILDVDRSKIIEYQNAMWQYGASRVLNWSVEDGDTPITIGSATGTNIIDGSSTAVAASSPGYTLIMNNRSRLSGSGVPVVMKAFGKVSSGTGGNVTILDSAGSTVAQINAAWGTTASWQSVSFNLPATTDKYDIMFSSAGAPPPTFSLYAVSIYEYEA